MFSLNVWTHLELSLPSYTKNRYQVSIFLILSELWQKLFRAVDCVKWSSTSFSGSLILLPQGGQLDERRWERGWKILLLVDYRSRCRISIEFNLFNSEFDMAELRRVNQVWDGFDLQHFKPCSGSLFIFLEAKSKIMNVVPHAINAVIFNIKTQRCKYNVLKFIIYTLTARKHPLNNNNWIKTSTYKRFLNYNSVTFCDDLFFLIETWINESKAHLGL